MTFTPKKLIGMGLIAVVVIIGVVMAAFWPIDQSAVAVVSLQPMAGAMKVGQQFSEKVVVRSNKPANAIDLTVHYNTGQLEVVKTESKQTRFDMVLFPPNVNSSNGTIRFVQATAAPFSGQGDDGLVGSITFKAKRAGQPTITVSGKVIANDSKGTDLAVKPASKALWRVILHK